VGETVTLGGGTTTTNSATVDQNVTVTNGGVLDSNTITLNDGGVLDLSNGSVVYQRLNGYGPTGGIVDTGGSTFTNSGGSTVSGFLTFTGNLTNNGTLAPGASPGIVTVLGNFDNAGGTLDSELGGLGAPGANPNGFDQVRVGGTATADGRLIVRSYNGFRPVQGNRFQIISDLSGGAKRVAGTFDSVSFDPDGVAGSGDPLRNAALVFDRATGAITATGLNRPGSKFADLGANPNQRGAARAIFQSALVGPNQIDSSTTAGLFALQLTDASGNSASDLARYVPDYYGAIADAAFLGDRELARSVQDRVTLFHRLGADPKETL